VGSRRKLLDVESDATDRRQRLVDVVVEDLVDAAEASTASLARA